MRLASCQPASEPREAVRVATCLSAVHRSDMTLWLIFGPWRLAAILPPQIADACASDRIHARRRSAADSKRRAVPYRPLLTLSLHTCCALEECRLVGWPSSSTTTEKKKRGRGFPS